MQPLDINRDSLTGAKYHAEKKINCPRYSLEDKIRSSFRKDNPDGIYDAVCSFFSVQYVLYENLKKGLNSAEALIFSTYIASKYGQEILEYNGEETCDNFNVNKKVRFDAPYPDPVNALIEAYLYGISTRNSVKLEALTEAYFDWIMKTSLSTIESSFRSLYEVITVKEININGKVIKIDFQEHKTAQKREISLVDLSAYEKDGQNKPSKGASGGGVAVIPSNGKTNQPIIEKVESKGTNEADYIYGHNNVKKDFEEMIFIIKNKEWFLKRYPSNRILNNYLMIGPPGTGKTTLAKSLADKTGFYFIPIPCRNLMTSFINESAQEIRRHYESVKAKIIKEGYKGGIIFLDEIDSLISARDDGERGAARENNKAVNEMNLCLEGYLDVPIVTIGATNMDHLIDPAIRSRFQVVWVGYPETDEGITAIYTTVFKKIEDFRGENLFEEIDFNPILEMTKSNERYKSGRTINNVVYAACRRRDIECLRGSRTSLVTTDDIYNQLVKYDFNKEDGYQKEANTGARPLEVLSR